MTRTIFWIAILFPVLNGCQHNPLLPEATQIVLQAYLYDSEPVTNITVMLSRTLSSSDTINTILTNANVVLTKDGEQYHLTPSMQNGGEYYYPGTDLQVHSGDQFGIAVTYNGTTATAETVVPGKPAGLSANTSTIVFTKDTVTTPFGDKREIISSSDSLVLTWDNPSQLPHYIVVESDDSARQPLGSDTLGNINFSGRFVTEPTTDNYYRVQQFNFNYTGKYKVTLYRVNREYVDLYASRQQDSRNLNEPKTNVKNGLGIFTAFASDSASISVKLE
jgi:hypothetical protein